MQSRQPPVLDFRIVCGEGILIGVLIGVLIVAASIAAFLALLPKDGKVHRLATAPILESIIPLGIVAGLAVGTALTLSGLVRL